MYEIIEYSKEYEYAAKKLIIDISVKEYGFKEFEKGFFECDYDKYKRSGGNFWIALDENKNVIGTMALEKSESIGYLSGVYVHSEYRGTGISKKLLDLVIEFSKNNNIQSIILGTYEKYSRAIKFYEKNNFKKFKVENEELFYKLDL